MISLYDHVAPRLLQVSPHLLDPSPTNPRKSFPQPALEELAASIRQVGVMSPLLVRPAFAHGRYEIVAGERRWRAATLAQVEHIPVIVRELSDAQVVEMQCIENLQREDVSAHEEAAGFKLLVEKFDYKPEAIAEKIGKSRSYVFGRLKLTELHQDVLDWMAADEVELSASHLLLVARIPTPQLQLKAAKELAGEAPPYWKPMSFRDAQDHVQEHYMLRLHVAPWWKLDPKDLTDAGTCGGCPKRSGNACDLFHEVADPNVCTDPDCHADKRKAWARRARDEAEARGIVVLPHKESMRVLASSNWHPDPDWVRLDDVCEQDAEKRTWRKLIEASGAEVAIAAAQEKDTGKLVELAARAAVGLVAKALKIKMPKAKKEQERPRSAYDPERMRADLEREMIGRNAVFTAVRLRYQREPAFTREELETIALVFTRWLNEAADLWPLWGWPEDKSPHGPEFAAWHRKRIAEMSAEDLGRLLIDAALIDVDANEGDYDLLGGTAARLGLDVESIRAQALAEHDAKVGTVEKAPTKKKRAPAWEGLKSAEAEE